MPRYMNSMHGRVRSKKRPMRRLVSITHALRVHRAATPKSAGAAQASTFERLLAIIMHMATI